MRVLAEIQLERILATLEAEQPAVCGDRFDPDRLREALTSAPGSVAQVRECAAQLTRVAKASGTTIILVGHVTKDGALAGPRVLEHIVDTVLYFEGDTHSSFRLVRAFKNRFGAVNEIGVFAMTEKGLKGVSQSERDLPVDARRAGAGRRACWSRSKGTRPMLVEVQALVDAGGPSPRRLSVGLERDRLAMLLAVLHRHAGIAVLRPGRVRQRGRRRAHQRAGRRPRGDAGDPVEPARQARCRAASSRSARSASPARCGPRRAARSACARRPSSASRCAIVPKANAPKAQPRRRSKG